MRHIIAIGVLMQFVGLTGASANPVGGVGVSPWVLVTPQPPASTNFMLSLPPSLGFTNKLNLDPRILNETNASVAELNPRSIPHYSLRILKPNREIDYCLEVGKPNAGTNYVIHVIR